MADRDELMALPTTSGRRSIGFGRRLILGVATALLFAVFALSAWTFAWPEAAARGEYPIRASGDFAPGSVTSYLVVGGNLRELPPGEYYDERPPGYPTIGTALIHVVRFPNGEFRVFSGAARFLDSTIVWYRFDDLGGLFDDEWVGLFAEGRRGSRWTIDGTRVFGPASGGLDEYAYRIRADGVLVIDLADLTEGITGPDSPPPYNVSSEEWPTSGWPSR